MFEEKSQDLKAARQREGPREGSVSPSV